MTRRQKALLGLTTVSSMLMAVSWFAWWWLSSGAATVSMAAAPGGAVEERVPIAASPKVRLEFMFNDGKQRPLNSPEGLQLRYSTRSLSPGSEAQLEFEVKNLSPVVANIGFFVTDRSVAVKPQRDYRIAAVAERAETSDLRASMGLGFHLYGDKGYLGEWARAPGRVAWQLPGAQKVEANFRVDDAAPDDRVDRRPVFIAPRFSIVNIEPGATVSAVLRWEALRVVEVSADRSMLVIERLPAPRVVVPQRGVYHLTVRGDGSTSVGSTDEEVLLIEGGGAQWATRRLASRWATPGEVNSAWAWKLPANMPPGQYEVFFGIQRGTSDQWQASRAGAGAVRRGDGAVKIGSLVVSPAGAPTMKLGMSFHRFPGRSQHMLGPIQVDYDFARSLAADGMSGMEWWRGVDKYEWKKVDAWAGLHARDGRGVIMVFSGSPTWASMRPQEHSAMWIPGYAAPPEHHLWDAYGRLVEVTVKRLKGKLLAVECWNEPDLKGGFTGTQTELADLCKIVSQRSKAAAPEVPIICPQAESAHGMPFVLGAKTSEGESITQFCDYVGAHVYGAMGDDSSGRPYDEHRIHHELRRMNDYLAKFGIDKPLAVTEYGIASCGGKPLNGHQMFSLMSSEDAGQALYQSVRAFREGGVRLLGLYSYDHEDRDPKCRPGGSFIRSTTSDVFGSQSPDLAVLGKINEAKKQFSP